MSVELNEKDEAKVSQVIASLPIVQPPGDFDVRVRSRIAAGKPADRRSWLWPVLAGATPVVLLMAIGLYFVLRTDTKISPNVASMPATEQTQPTSVSDKTVPTLVANSSFDIPIPDRMTAKTRDVDDRMIVPTKPTRGPNVGGGSYDETINEKKTTPPRGIGSNRRIVTRPPDFDKAISISIKDVLTQIGVNSQGTESGMKVVSVTPDGAANRLGLKANDVIESIDDKPVNDKTTYKGKFAGKRMKVVRDGQPVEIDLSKP